MSSIFEPRTAFKPYEYPKAIQFIEALQSTIWDHREFNFNSDISDYNNKMSDHEKGVTEKCLLAISQIEISVKTFWGDLPIHFPKAEFSLLGTMLSYNETVHALSYSSILDHLGLQDSFSKILEVPEIKGRVNYLKKYLENSKSKDNQKYVKSIALFSSFIENCSLFSQFFILKSMKKHKNYFNGVDNVLNASAIEEGLHAECGAWIISEIKNENPTWFDQEFIDMIYKATNVAFDAEVKIIDWILQEQELEFLSRHTIIEFLKNRFNKSLILLGVEPLFTLDLNEEDNYYWFEAEVAFDRHTDFFNQESTAYSRNLQSVTEHDLF